MRSYPERGTEGLLTWLPTELLEHTFTDFDIRPNDLYHLSLTNRRLSQVAQPLLYGEVDLTSDQAAAMELFCESVCNNPKLPPLLRELRFSSLKGHEWIAFPEKITHALEHLLRLELPKLRELVVCLDQVKIDIQALNPNLKVRYINMDHTTLDEAVRLMSMPALEHLYIHLLECPIELEFWGPDRHLMAESGELLPANFWENQQGPARLSKRSTVQQLTIERGLRVHPWFSPLLALPQNLVDLYGVVNLRNSSLYDVGRWLRPLHKSLRDMYLHLDYDLNLGPDLTYCRFDQFQCLTRMSVASVLVFGHDSEPEDRERINVFERLPKTLRQLSIAFGTDGTIIDTGRYEAYTGVDTPLDYLWIINLRNLPRLKTLSLEEHLGSHMGTPSYRCRYWEPHPLITRAFQARDLYLYITLRDEQRQALELAQRENRLQAQRLAREAQRNQT